jgi:hypothetical protein
MYFLNKDSYRLGFTFKEPYPNTPTFRREGLAGQPHLGVDCLCPQGTVGIATLSGTSSYLYGSGGGLQCHFRPDGTNDLIRFLHLMEKPKTGRIKPGDHLFRTGHSGYQSSGVDHVHIDIWDLNKGPLNIYNIKGFKDPAKYAWQKGNMQIIRQAKGAERRLVIKAADQNQWNVFCAAVGLDPNGVDETV